MQTALTTSNEARQLVDSLISLQKVRRKIDVERGRILYQLRANRLYLSAYGEGVDTWEEFLRSPEIGLSISEANRAMQLYEYFVIRYQVDERVLEAIPVRTLTHILPSLKLNSVSQESLQEILSSAKELTFFEFKERLRDIQHGTERTYSYMVMRRCNETKNLSRVIEISSDNILSAYPHLNEYNP